MTAERLVSKVRWATAILVAVNLLLVLAAVRCQRSDESTGKTGPETNRAVELPPR
jgi:hypothetical protein